MRLIGLTGNIASGKTAVADMLAERGATIVDADVLARDAVTKGSPALDAIVARWGKTSSIRKEISTGQHFGTLSSKTREISTRSTRSSTRKCFDSARRTSLKRARVASRSLYA